VLVAVDFATPGTQAADGSQSDSAGPCAQMMRHPHSQMYPTFFRLQVGILSPMSLNRSM